MKRTAIFAFAMAGIGMACTFDLPVPVDGGTAVPFDTSSTSTTSTSSGLVSSSSTGSSTSSASSTSGLLADAGVFCVPPTSWLHCDDFSAALPGTWTVETEGAGSKVESVAGVLAASLPLAVSTNDPKKAQIAWEAVLDESGLHIEFDAFLHNTATTESYELLGAVFKQSTAGGAQSMAIHDDDSFAAVLVETPTSAWEQGAPLPKQKWLHLTFEIRPNASKGSFSLRFRERDTADSPERLVVSRDDLSFDVSASTRAAVIHLGVARGTALTPAVRVDYDHFEMRRL